MAKIKGLVKDTDRHGNARYYFRRAGQPKVRIRSTYGTPEFREEVRCAELGIPFAGIDAPKPIAPRSPAAKSGSLKWLSLEYARRNKATWSAGYFDLIDRVLTEICLETNLSTSGAPNGDLTYSGMQLKHVAQLRDEKSDLPHAANRRIKTLSAMFTWAIGAGLAKHNPAKDCPKVKTSGDGFHTWTLDEIAKYRYRHAVGSKHDLALRLFLMTGLRKSDVAILGRQHIYDGPDGRRIRITPGKTKSSSRVVVDIPLLPSLAEAVDRVPKTQMTFLVSARGKPHSPAMLGNLMREWCDQAELPHCSAHGLRKAGAVIAAEAGATSQQLQAIFGWTTSEQADHYTKAANRKKLATDGAKLLTMAPQVGQSGK
ncbi:tyrosine-type recombinase/integrase [Devosia sp. A369]